MVFAVWAIWSAIAAYLDASEWVWRLLPLALGVGGQCLLDAHRWWLGLGLGGAAVLLMRIGDLLLVTADWVKVAVLRSQKTR